jgi:hypothetical protein
MATVDEEQHVDRQRRTDRHVDRTVRPFATGPPARLANVTAAAPR